MTRRSKVKDRVYDLLGKGEYRSPEDLARPIGCSAHEAKRAVSELIEEGLVERRGSRYRLTRKP